MTYPPLTVSWAVPLTHEREICRDLIYEIRYGNALAVLAGFTAVTAAVLVSGIYLLFLPAVLVLPILFPLVIRPWDVILSNKRLILRQRYWGVGRFSRIISFNLAHLDTNSVTPRFKVLPFVTGITLLTSYTLPLLDHYVTGTVPLPTLLEGLLAVLQIIGAITAAQKFHVVEMLNTFISPFREIELLLIMASLLIGVLLLLLGLPRRKSITLSSEGGHVLRLNTGFPMEIFRYLNSVGRRHKFSENDDWTWGIPLLDDENVHYLSRIGIINKNQLLVGLLSLIFFIESVSRIRIRAPIDLLAVLANAVILWSILITIVFAKYLVRIVATDHRIILQQERRGVSGLLGRRVYEYTDVPFENIQGYSFSKFTAFSPSSIISGLLVYIIGIVLAVTLIRPGIAVTGGVMAFLMVVSEYRTFTSLQFTSVSGRRLGVSYKLPYYMEWISHRLEGRDWIYERIFPNVITEEEVAGILNLIRGVVNPAERGGHEVTYRHLRSGDEEEIERWNRLTPYRYARGSVALGLVIGLAVLLRAQAIFQGLMKAWFITLTILLLGVTILRSLVLLRHTLVLYPTRLFKVLETQPSKLALAFGILPLKEIQEMRLRHLVSVKYNLSPQSGNSFLSFLSLMATAVLSVRVQEVYSGFEWAVFVLVPAAIASLPLLLRDVARSLPRYTLHLQARYGGVQIPYMRYLKTFSQQVTEVARHA